MPLPTPRPGLVVCYSYLWYSEYMRGQDEGVKHRPCVIIMAVENIERDVIVTVVPITHVAPALDSEAVEIPLPTKSRLGLDSDRAWAVVSEVNRFVWPGPDLRPISRDSPHRFDYGMLPPRLYKEIAHRLRDTAARQRLAMVSRAE